MKKTLLISAVLVLTGVTAMAHPYYHEDHYYGGPGDNEVASILSAYTGALFLTSASQCSAGPGCAYKEAIVEAKDDAAVFLATDGDQKGVKLTRALELLRQMDSSSTSSDAKLAQDILDF